MRRRPKKAVFSLGLGRFWLFCPLRRLTGRLGPYGKPLTGRDGPYGKGPLTERDGPYGKGPLTGSPLQGWLPLQKRTAYGKQRGEILPELGGNFRLCAVDQKRPCFLRAGPFLAFLPFKEAYGKAGPLREALRRRTVLTGRAPLRRGTVLTGRAPLRGVPYGDGSLYKKGRPMGSYGERFYQNWAGISACAP